MDKLYYAVAAREEELNQVALLEYGSPITATRANDTIYGLSAYISAGDLEKAKQMARRIESGRVIINAVVNSQSQTPFGGFKQSGIGRSGWMYGIKMHLSLK